MLGYFGITNNGVNLAINLLASSWGSSGSR